MVTAFDQGLGRGDGVFESVAVHRRPHPAPRRRTSPGCARSAALLELADPGRRRSGAPWSTRVLADWPADVEGVCRLFLTRGLGEGSPPTAARAAVAGARRGAAPARPTGIAVVSLGLGVPADFRATAPWLLGGAKTLSYAVNMAALRHAHARRRRRRRLHLAGGPAARGPDARPSSGPPAAGCTPRRWTPASCPAPPSARLFARAEDDGWPTARHPGTVADLHAADAVWLLSGIRGAAHGAHAGRRPAGRRRAHGAGPGAARPVGSRRCAGKSGRQLLPTPPWSRLVTSPPAVRRGSWPETSRIAEVLRKETVGGALLLVGTRGRAGLGQLALVGRLRRAARHRRSGPAALHLRPDASATWAADGLLAIFFFVAGLELKREFVAGDLRDPRRAALPVAAAVGGMVGAGAALRRWSTSAPAAARCAAGRSRPPPTSPSRSPCSR